jgi:hypothetical protein
MKVAQIDFDGTIVTGNYPEIGEPMPDAFAVLKELKEHGWKLILFTCREDMPRRKYLQEAVDFCLENGVKFDAINETIEDLEFRPPDCLKRKPYCSVIIDDINLGGFPGWDTVRELLIG